MRSSLKPSAPRIGRASSASRRATSSGAAPCIRTPPSAGAHIATQQGGRVLLGPGPVAVGLSVRGGLQAGHLEVLADLDGDALPVLGGQVRLVDAVGVGLHPQHGRAGVPGQRRRADLAGGVAAQQVLVGSLALGLVHRSTPMVRPDRDGRAGVGGVAGGGGGGAGGQRSRQYPADQEPAAYQRDLATPASPAGGLGAVVQLLPPWLVAPRVSRVGAMLAAGPWPDLGRSWQLAGN